MFTINHVRPNGSQELFKAVRVQYIPADPKEPLPLSIVHFLCGPDEGGPGIAAGSARDGTIYVMNDKGATVATYQNLGPPLTPQPS